MKFYLRCLQMMALVASVACGPTRDADGLPSWLGDTYLIVDLARDNPNEDPTFLEHYVFRDGAAKWERFEQCDGEPHHAELDLELVKLDEERVTVEPVAASENTVYPYGLVEIWPLDCGRLFARDVSLPDSMGFVLWEMRSCETLGARGGFMCGDFLCEGAIAFFPGVCSPGGD
jgi:hypothetical protein